MVDMRALDNIRGYIK